MAAGVPPSPTPTDGAWIEGPPDPLASPEPYDGVLWRRVLAYLVDLVAIGLLWIPAFVLMSVAGLLSLGLLFPLIPIGLGLLPIAYHTLLIGGPWSATVGMLLFGVEVRGWTGLRPSYLQAFVMSVIFYATVWPTGLLVLVVALLNARHRTLHDYLAGVVVVRRAPVAALLAEGRRA